MSYVGPTKVLTWPHDMTHNGAMDELQKINARFPDILYRRMQAKVKEEQALDPGFSMNSYLVRLVREDLDGPEVPRSGALVGYEIPSGTYKVGQEIQGRKLTAAELAAKFGIKTGATIHESESPVEPGLPGTLGPGALSESLPGETDLQTDEGQMREFIRVYGKQAWELGMRMPSFKKAKWPQRFEIAEGKKERGE